MLIAITKKIRKGDSGLRLPLAFDTIAQILSSSGSCMLCSAYPTPSLRGEVASLVASLLR